LKVAPKTRGEGFEFLNNTVGASIPRNFIPAVEKGLREDLTEGPLLVVSSHRPLCKCFRRKHAVDSDEGSFKISASQAFRDAFLKAKSVLLEPIYLLTITAPEEFMGDVMGDLTARRGRISGTDSEGHFQIISAEVPLAEIDRYATRLRSVTHGKGVHTQKLAYYCRTCPPTSRQRLSLPTLNERKRPDTGPGREGVASFFVDMASHRNSLPY